MAKEAKMSKEEALKKPEDRVQPKPIVAVDDDTVAKSLALTPYKSTAVAEFGNKFVISLVAAAAAEEDAQKQLAAAGEAKQFLSFEMTRAVFDLAQKHKEGKDAVDVYAVFGEAKDVEKLNTKVLIHMGVLKREIGDDDTVNYVWTDPSVEKLYSYTKKLKEEAVDEYTKRFNNRKRLNARLSDAYKAAAALMDQGLSSDDLFYSEDANNILVPTIRNAPKAIGGETGTVQMNSRKPVTGATMSPTMSSLVSIANNRHKAAKADRNDKGENREGDAKLGMTDEAFGNIVNTLRRAVNAQEGEFTDEMKKQLKALSSYLTPIVEAF